MSETPERLARELKSLTSKYTIADGNALRVVHLLYADIAEIADRLRALPRVQVPASEDGPVWIGPDLVREAGLKHVSAEERTRVFDALDAVEPALQSHPKPGDTVTGPTEYSGVVTGEFLNWSESGLYARVSANGLVHIPRRSVEVISPAPTQYRPPIGGDKTATMSPCDECPWPGSPCLSSCPAPSEPNDWTPTVGERCRGGCADEAPGLRI